MAMKETIGTAIVELDADFKQLEKAMKDLESTMKDSMSAIEKLVERDMKNVEKAFKDGMDDSEDAIDKSMKDIEGAFKDGMSDSEKAINTGMNDIEDSFKDGINESESAIKRDMDDIADAFKSGMSDAETSVDRGMDDIEKAMTGGMDDAERSIERSMDSVESAFRDGMKDAEKAVENSMDDIENAVEDGTSGMEDIVTKGMVGVAAAFAAIGVGAFAAATDFASANGIIQAGLGLTGEEAEAVKEKAKALWREGFGTDIEDAASRVVIAHQSLKDLNDQDFDHVIMAADALEKKLGVDYADSIRAVDSMTKNFGITGEAAMDLIVKGFQSGLDVNGDFLDTLDEYSPVFSTIGLDAEDMFQIMMKGAEDGTFNMDKLGDAVKEMNIKVLEGSKDTAGAFATLGIDMGETQQAFKEGGEAGKEAFAKIIQALADVEDPVERNKLAIALMGTPFEDLGDTALEALGNIEGGIDGVSGKSGELVDIMKNEHAATWDDVWRQMQEAMAPVGEELMLLASTYMPAFESAMGGLSEVAKVFSGESDSVIAKLTAWSGGVLLVLGAITQLAKYAGLKTFLKDFKTSMTVATAGGATFSEKLKQVWAHLKNVTGATGRWAAGLTFLTTIVAPIALIIGAFAGTFALLWKNWDDVTNKTLEWIDLLAVMSPGVVIAVAAVKGLFGSFEEGMPGFDAAKTGVSEGTASLMNDFLKLEESAQTAWHSVSWGGLTISEPAIEAIKTSFAAMRTFVVEQFEKQGTESITAMEEFYANSSVLHEKEEQAALARSKEYLEKNVKDLSDKEARVLAILEQAKTQAGGITQEQRDEINAIYAEMRKYAVESVSKSGLEQRALLDGLRLSATAITAEQSAAVVKSSKEQRDKSVKAAEEQYQGIYENIVYQRDVVGSISAEQAEKLIEEAVRQKEGAITEAEVMHAAIISEAKAQAGEHVEWVDWETGEILNRWEKMAKDIAFNEEEIAGFLVDLVGAYKTMKTETVKFLLGISQGWDDLKEDIMSGVLKAAQYINAYVDMYEVMKAEAVGFLMDIVRGWDDLSNGISAAITVAKALINGFLRKYNGLSISFAGIDVPGVGSVGGFSWGVPQIPYLAKGGLTTGPTMAMIGEGRHDEAVLPLSDKVFQKLADGINGQGGNGSGLVQNITTVADPYTIQRYTERALRKQAWGL